MISKAAILIFALFLAEIAGAQTYCTSQTNVTTGQMMSFSLGSVAYKVVQNYITPDNVGITINGSSYTLDPNSPKTINSNTGAYVELVKINYLPIQQSVNFIMCSAQQGPSTFYSFNLSDGTYGDPYFTYYGTKLIIDANLPISQALTNFPTNVTESNVTYSTPSPPSGYVKLTALDINIVTGTNATVNMTQDVPCYVTPSGIAVEELVKDSWVLVYGYTLNSTACTVTASMPNDPVVGIFYSSSATATSTAGSTSATTSATTIPTTTVMSTTTQPTTSSVYTTTLRSTSTASTSTTSVYTTTSLLTTTITISATSVPSYTNQTAAPAQPKAPSSSTTNLTQSQVDLLRYIVLAAMALSVIYLIYLFLPRK